MVQSKHKAPPRIREKTLGEKICYWIYSLGVSIMMFALAGLLIILLMFVAQKKDIKRGFRGIGQL
jgi:cytochrome b subunit of formate dehydrogenase